MENGNGTTQPLSVPTSVWPWGVNDVVAAAETVIPGPPPPSPSPRKPRWYETTEGRAERGALIKAGWAKRRAAQQRAAARLAAAQKEVDGTAKAAGLDAAIEFHRNALNTLIAAKALLK